MTSAWVALNSAASASPKSKREGPFGLTIERDLHFRVTDTLTHYAAEALRHGRIVA